MPLTDAQSQALSAGISAAGTVTNSVFNQIFAEHNRKRILNGMKKPQERQIKDKERNTLIYTLLKQ